jgi:tetratricopeptide (TPR) repeat protein
LTLGKPTGQGAQPGGRGLTNPTNLVGNVPRVVEAERHARGFRWIKAARAYRKYLATNPRSSGIERGVVLERISLYRFKAAMQSRTQTGFRRGIASALSSCEDSSDCFKELGDARQAYVLRCQATSAYLNHWLAKSPRDKKRQLDRSWDLTKKSLRRFEQSKQYREFAETYNQLSVAASLASELDRNLQARITTIMSAIEHGRKTIGILRSTPNKTELATALVRTALFLDGLIDCISDQEKIRGHQTEAGRFWGEGLRTSKESALREFCRPPQGFYRILSPPESLKISDEALRIAVRERDNFAIGWIVDKLAKWNFFAAVSTEDHKRVLRMHRKALSFAEKAALKYEKINFVSPVTGVLWAHSPYVEYFSQIATYENDPNRRRLLQEKSVRSVRELIKLAEKSEHLHVIAYAFHNGGKTETVLADMETNVRRKRELLRSALNHRISAVRTVNQIDPVLSWNRAAMLLNLADSQAKFAGLQESARKRRELLREAALNTDRGLRQATAFVNMFEHPENHVLNGQLGLFHLRYGRLLEELSSITKDNRYLRRSAKEYTSASDCYKGVSRYEKLAESYWRAAEIYDRLQANNLAAEDFELSSNSYTILGRQVPQLKEYSQDYALYMRAWNRIELARSRHRESQYAASSRAYNMAARLHRSTKRWRFLAPYYSAWSKLEFGESLSQNGRHEEAIEAFQKATELFSASRVVAKQRLSLLDQPDERTMVERLVGTASEDYCRARITLEEALLAENRDERHASFEKFGLASEKLRAISTVSRSELDRRETGFLSTLCRAWQLSDKAELEDSTGPLDEARALFAKARKMGMTESARGLASGHEGFCQAQIASRKFVQTLRPEHYQEASLRLDQAAEHYRQSGFLTASYHAIGRKLQLDAYVRLNEASNERDQKKKAQLYKIASDLLLKSAQAFLKAQQPKKRKQALGLLKKARAESNMAFRLTEMLNEASAPPSNVAFPSLEQGNERAVGLDRFEHADIEASLARTKFVAKGDIEFEVDILNIGDRPITLLNIGATTDGGEILVPTDMSRVLVRRPYHKAVDPAKVETVRLLIRPKKEGLVKIKPWMVFVDERGQQRERILEPTVVATSRIIEFLAESFVRDDSERRLLPANCGWRTLMEIVKSLGIPRSHVYGEPRYGRSFGRQLESLVKSSQVEYRIFPGERGRGGDITRVRVSPENEDVKRYLEQLTLDQGKTRAIELIA